MTSAPGIISIVRTAITTGFCAIAAHAVSSDELSLQALFDLEQLPVFIASAKEEGTLDAPAHIYVISGTELRERGYRSLYDLLEDLPGCTGNRVVNTADPYDYPKHMGVSANVRGTPGGLKLMFNGMVFDAKDGTINLWEERFPIETIEKVEFILGPYASLYGRNTYTGVLNVVTKNGEQLGNGGEFTELFGKTRHMQRTIYLGSKPGGVDLFGSYFNTHSEKGLDMVREYPEIYGYDARQGKTFRTPWGSSEVDFTRTGAPAEWYTPWDNTDVYVRATHDLGLAWDFQYNRIKVPNMDPKRSPLYYVAPREATLTMPVYNTRLNLSRRWTEKLTTETEASYQTWTWRAVNMYNSPEEWRTKRILKQAENFDGKLAGRYVLFTGNEVYAACSYAATHEWVPPHRYTGWPDLNDSATKVFRKRFLNVSLQDEWRIGRSFKTVAGVMYEKSNYHVDILIPRLSLMWNRSDVSVFKLLYGSGFITPDMATLAQAPMPSGDTLKGYDEIKPMLMQSCDLQWLYRFGPRMRTSASVFYTTEEEQTTTTDSISRRERWGGELELNSFFLDGVIKSFASYQFVHGRTREIAYGKTETFDKVPYTPRHQGKLGVHYYAWEKKINLYVHGIVMSKLPNLKNLDDCDGNNVVDVFVSTTEQFHRRFSVSAGVKNVFDKKAFIPPSTDGMRVDGFSYETYTITTPIRRRYWTVEASVRF
ncbi:MAG: TonB-dependent receptor plug domain-containing protein [Chitinispirillaceae bacterium]|nr:TonB-dependent receptor plug domain-containing protein [Chitinispirillaceae bacterium]